MKTTTNFIKCAILIFAITITSCSKDGDIGPIGPQGEQGIQGDQGPAGEDGEDGEGIGIPGPQGEQGPAGENGTDGTNGMDGTNGTDGTNGEDGEDGNANVATYTYDLSSESGSTIVVTAPVLTQEVIDNDLILGYLLKGGTTYTPIPAPIYAFGLNDNSDIAVEINLNRYWMYFYEVGTENFKSVSAGQLDELKLVVIESNSTTSGKSSKENMVSRLKSAGVDTNDYYAVMDYFGLDY
ncbi:hypothetical protein A9200_17465 [Maribacter hydrothermalis]|uniref:Collagen triple helix repeat-containing protein n=1 Tax=Maribacter hydrothermalis TaxID=1836467 RepID=A0A1B7Z9K0_9FLAO|nr:collagen-like protein [Maribacter hydrothermalis]OBR39394.1 hypothetical protein A9200_17465 [Maribacter hydrothermalis]